MLWWCMFMCKSRNEKTGTSDNPPHTLRCAGKARFDSAGTAGHPDTWHIPRNILHTDWTSCWQRYQVDSEACRSVEQSENDLVTDRKINERMKEWMKDTKAVSGQQPIWILSSVHIILCLTLPARKKKQTSNLQQMFTWDAAGAVLLFCTGASLTRRVTQLAIALVWG